MLQSCFAHAAMRRQSPAQQEEHPVLPHFPLKSILAGTLSHSSQRELKLLGMLCYVIWIEGLVPSNTTELIHIHAPARTMCSPVIDFYFQRGLLGLWMGGYTASVLSPSVFISNETCVKADVTEEQSRIT